MTTSAASRAPWMCTVQSKLPYMDDPDLVPHADLLAFMDELHLFCEDTVPREIEEMTNRVLSLQSEMETKEALYRQLQMRTRRLSNTDLTATERKIGELALFIHLADLSILKFKAFLGEQLKGKICAHHFQKPKAPVKRPLH